MKSTRILMAVAAVALTLAMTLLIALYGQPFIDLANNSAQILAANF